MWRHVQKLLGESLLLLLPLLLLPRPLLLLLLMPLPLLMLLCWFVGWLRYNRTKL